MNKEEEIKQLLDRVIAIELELNRLLIKNKYSIPLIEVLEKPKTEEYFADDDYSVSTSSSDNPHNIHQTDLDKKIIEKEIIKSY